MALRLLEHVDQIVQMFELLLLCVKALEPSVPAAAQKCNLGSRARKACESLDVRLREPSIFKPDCAVCIHCRPFLSLAAYSIGLDKRNVKCLSC